MFYITRGKDEFLASIFWRDGSFVWRQSPPNGWMDAHHFEEEEEAEGTAFCEKNPGARMVWFD